MIIFIFQSSTRILTEWKVRSLVIRHQKTYFFPNRKNLLKNQRPQKQNTLFFKNLCKIDDNKSRDSDHTNQLMQFLLQIMLSVSAKFYLICPNSLPATTAYIGPLSFSIVHRESHAIIPLPAPAPGVLP